MTQDSSKNYAIRSAKSERNSRILIIDDNVAIHEDYAKILAPSGDSEELQELESLLFQEDNSPQSNEISFELTSAFQGQEALGIVKQAVDAGEPFSLAFVDMRMPPGWDGLETIKQIWKVDPDLQVVICSAYSDHTWSELVDQLSKEDQWLLLRKPFDSAEVCQLALALTKKWNLQLDSRRAFAELQLAVKERDALLDALAESTNQALGAYSLSASKVESAFKTISGLLSERQYSPEAAAEGGQPGGRQQEQADAESVLAETVASMHESLELFRQVHNTAAGMREGVLQDSERE